MDRGDGRTIKITATYREAIPEQNIGVGDPFPLNDKTVYFTAKRKYSEPDDTTAIFKKTTGGGGITVRSSPNNHIADVSVVKADTEALERATTLACDCRAKAAGADPITVAKGTLTVSLNATRTTT